MDYKGYSISIEPDHDVCESPREWAHVGTWLTFHRQGDHGDVAVRDWETDYEVAYDDVPTCVEDWVKYIKEHKQPRVVLPVFVYSHGSSHFSVGAPVVRCQFDTAVAGLIFDTPEGIKECWGDTVPTDEQLAESMKAEVETYTQYVNGDVYGYVIESPDGSSWVGDSCWGFYGEEYAEQEAKAAIDSHIEYLAREDAKVSRCMAL